LLKVISVQFIFLIIVDRILLLPAQSEVETYVMKLPDIEKFEERLRKAEDELGIKQDSRVPVTFERSK